MGNGRNPEEYNFPEWAASVYRQYEKEIVPNNIRKSVLRRDGNHCVRCKARKNLEVHHIIPRSEGGEANPENLVTLCRACHDEIELLGLRTRALIENWGLGKDHISCREPAPNPNDWHSWVYGGYARPRLECEQPGEQVMSVPPDITRRS